MFYRLSLALDIDYNELLESPLWQIKERAFVEAENSYFTLLLMIDAQNIAQLSKDKLNEALSGWRERIMEQQPLTQEQMMQRKRQLNSEAFNG